MLASTILIADDHPLFRTALKQAVGQCLPNVTMLEANSVDELFNVVESTPELEIMFLDLHMPGNNGFTSLTRLQNHHPDIIIIMVSSDDAPEIMQKAIDFGAAAFIPKSADLTVISDAITAVLEGDTWLPKDANLPSQTNHNDKKLAKQLALLTPQQYVVLSQIADGQLNKQIAYDLNIKETTVKKHVSAILLKLEVTNRTMAGMAFQQLTLN
ncbi:response regulator transcription factor [Psychrosphaera sp. 1_MG-2023]|uniref:response regulator transcription factor n=1 Tax=Psychrosphaera sp. 1_MG-2023 TaxID=3062643 RepID=UPI0026E3AE89|nr:response regulator transcription factor [Psychrosphaera sp. 1_MG-2023]MDO6717838.1 response regulator transcription factor [Psychrosphaera sp. 1_MG-2023]